MKEQTIKDQLIQRFDHSWRTLKQVSKDFDDHSWQTGGHGMTRPYSLFFHFIKGTKYYLKDFTPLKFSNGQSFDFDGDTIIAKEDIPRSEIDFITDEMADKTREWMDKMDLAEENQEYPWAGKTMGSVALFLLSHNQFHLGELNALLNEFQQGKAADHFAESLD